MASIDLLLPQNDNHSTFVFLLLLSVFSFSALNKINAAVEGCYTSIFSFGDSIADTGNCIQITADSVPPPHFALPPYGETFFYRPTGRCSDGRLIIDFISRYVGLPLGIQPYFGLKNASGWNVGQGLNFAVVGATALDTNFFEERGIYNPYTNYSLGVQLDWFKQILPSLCHPPSDCKKLLQSSLILMGEIGGNDINYAFFAGKKIDEIQSYVHPVVNTIGLAINELIELGAATFVVPGNFPIGCAPVYLNLFFNSSKEEDYDPETGCIIWLNEFSKNYNEMLRTELDRLQQLHPHATIIYADYFNAAMRFFQSPIKYGFSGGTTTACCGDGGPYNYNNYAQCGYWPSRACDSPSSFVSWDGIHLTEAAYQWIAEGLLEGPFTIPPMTATPCVSQAASS